MNILLLTDFSANSKNAIAYALQLFKDQECNFVVLNVQKAHSFTTDDLMTASATESIYESIMADNSLALKDFIEPIIAANNNPNHNFTSLIDYDVFYDAINQVIASHDIDYICMGTNGVTGAREVLFGSNTMNVVRHIKVPVLIVPEDYVFEPIKEILFSFSKLFDVAKQHVQPLLNIAQMQDSEVEFLAIHPPGQKQSISESITQIASMYFNDAKHCFYELGPLKPLPAITAFEQLHPVQLHCFFYHKESFMERWLDNSQTSKISHESKIPLLVLPV